MKKMSLSIFIAKVSCMIVYVTYHNMGDGAPCLFRLPVPAPVLGPAPALVPGLGPLLPPPPLPPPVVAAGAEAAAAAVGFIQRLQQVGAAVPADVPAEQARQCSRSRQCSRPSIGSI